MNEFELNTSVVPEEELGPLEQLISKNFFELTSNRDKTAVINAVAESTGKSREWIKDVVINNHGKRGRNIQLSTIADVVQFPLDQLNIQIEHKDPLYCTITSNSSLLSIKAAGAAPKQFGIALTKLLEDPDFSPEKSLVIINNGNNGPLSDVAWV